MTARRTRLYFRIQRAAQRIRTLSDGILIERAGITTAQSAVLVLIDAGPDTTQREIARQLGQTEAAITGMINRLVASGMVRRTRSREDGRVWQLRLTKRGRDTLDDASRAFGRVNAVLDRACAGHDLADLVTVLDAIAAASD